VGVIGCGFIGRDAPDSHVKAYFDCARTELVATCDKILAMWTEAPTHYLDYPDMLKAENLDIVSVCTPVETHCQIVCDIAPYVKAIYCEKPMATSLKECDKMIEVCDENNVILQINHQRRFVVPKFRFSRDLIGTGTHVFDLMRHLFREPQLVQVEFIDTQEHIFELDCTHNGERMILRGVEHLAECLDMGWHTISDGFEGKMALAQALEFKEQYERTR